MRVLITLFGGACATLDQMKQDLTNMAKNQSDAGMRNIPDILGSNLDNINEYGCWCYFMEDSSRGHSKPVDELDAFCRKLNRGYECAIADVADSTGDACVPWEVFYISGTGGGEAFLTQTCETFNNDPCAIHACKVEGMFVIKVFNIFVSGDTIDLDSFAHQNGFDVQSRCPTVNCKEEPSRCSSERACCGEYPDRFPYKSANRGCCSGKTFDMATLSCCQDGTIKATCA